MGKNKRDGDVIYDNFDQYTGQPFNTKILTELPDGTVITDALVDNAVIFKNKPEHGGGYSVRSEFLDKGQLDISWFGAKGDAIADDTVAFQTAIDTAASLKIGIIKLNGMGYNISRTLEIPAFDATNSAQISFRGEGRLSAIGNKWAYNDGFTVIRWVGEDSQYTSVINCESSQCWCDFESFAILNATTRTDVDGITLNHFKNGYMFQVMLFKFRRNLEIIGDYYYAQFVRCRFAYAIEVNVYTDGLSNMAAFYDTQISSGLTGFLGRNMGDGVTFQNCQIEGNTAVGIDVANCRILNIYGGYIENNAAIGGVIPNVRSQIIVRAFGGAENNPVIANIVGNYVMTVGDGVHFITTNHSGAAQIGNISINVRNNAIPSTLLLNDFDSGVEPTYVVYSPSAGNKIEVLLENNQYQQLETGSKKIYMPINNRPQDRARFYSNNDGATKRVRPEWESEGSIKYINTINVVAPSVVSDGSNKDTSSAVDLDFPELATQNGTIRRGRFTNTTGAIVENSYDPTPASTRITESFDFRTGIRRVSGRFGFLDTTNGASLGVDIFTGIAVPEGNFFAAKGSLYLYGNTSTNVEGVYVKTTAITLNTGWKLISVNQKATQAQVNAGTNDENFVTPLTLQNKVASTSVKGLVNQALASADTAVAPSAAYTQSEVQAILDELRDLKAKLRTAGILAT